MLSHVAFALGMLVVVVAARLIGQKAHLPSAVLLTVIGVVYALLPGNNLTLDPHLVMVGLIPPLLYAMALESSLLALRRNLRPVIGLSVVLVLVTTIAVGSVAAALIPGVTLAIGLAFGAAVAPPDPVAALSIGRRAGLPPRLLTLIEGEGLLNDATALTTYQVAVAAAVTGTGLSIGTTGLKFLEAAAGGLAIGLILAWILRLARPLLKDPLTANAVSLGTPFAAYAAGEAVHVSGVLAVVVVGLIVGHERPRTQSGAGRLQITAVWHLVEYLLEGFVFLLIGQQLPAVITGLDAYRPTTIVLTAVCCVGAVLLVRPVFLMLTNLAPRFLHARLGGDPDARRDMSRVPGLTGREIVAMSWAGTRGVISLAIAYALPLTLHDGRPFPGRDLILFCSYLVVLVTLVIQGVTFGPLVRSLKIRSDPADAIRVRNQARDAAVTSALGRLDEIAADEKFLPEIVAEQREQLERQQRRYRARLEAMDAKDARDARDADGTGADGNDETAEPPPHYEDAVRARRMMIDAQREELLRWRDAGRLSDQALRVLETELDLEERILPDHGRH